ncbi:hypothetical protein J1N35_031249 [Gossypium stocksii]|uniref:Uncharacterized protein n=1 Tax=Gossypium stocksii TaxID=47602 RepID=A0A9D3ZUW6_9ROSI|nr:hypothetical protein J1N35_031249 [Gossypium stocksii]
MTNPSSMIMCIEQVPTIGTQFPLKPLHRDKIIKSIVTKPPSASITPNMILPRNSEQQHLIFHHSSNTSFLESFRRTHARNGKGHSIHANMGRSGTRPLDISPEIFEQSTIGDHRRRGTWWSTCAEEGHCCSSDFAFSVLESEGRGTLNKVSFGKRIADSEKGQINPLEGELNVNKN